MNFIRETIQLTARRIRRTTMTSVFLIVGFVLSMLIISVGISFISEHLYAQKSKEELMPPNGQQFVITASSGKELKKEEMMRLFFGIREDSGIILNGLMASPDKDEINSYYPVSAEWFVKDDGWHYPVSEGRYFSAKEIEQQRKVVVIGEALKPLVREENGRQYLDLEGEAYEVIGIVGLSDQMSLWENRIIMPCTALPEAVMKELILSTGSMNLILYNDKGELSKDAKQITLNGQQLDSDFMLESVGELEVDDMSEQLFENQNQIYYVALLGYLVSIVFAVNIVVFWMEKRRYEIGIWKAFGFTDGKISKMIMEEMLGLTILAFLFATITQAGLSLIVERISDYPLKLYLPNVIAGLFVVCVTTLLTSIWPTLRALKVQPADIIKEGEENG